MYSELSEEILSIAEHVCRAAREAGNDVFTVYHEESELLAESQPGGCAKETDNWQT